MLKYELKYRLKNLLIKVPLPPKKCLFTVIKSFFGELLWVDFQVCILLILKYALQDVIYLVTFKIIIECCVQFELISKPFICIFVANKALLSQMGQWKPSKKLLVLEWISIF